MELALESILRNCKARGIPVDQGVLAGATAALIGGKHLLFIAHNVHRAEALAELIADEAVDAGASFGTLVTTGRTVALLPISEMMTAQFRSDIWLVLRGASATSLRRLANDLPEDPKPKPTTWRFLAVAPPSPDSIAQLWDAAGRLRVALVSVE